MMQKGIPPVVTIAASLLIGIVLGLINGIGVTVGKLAPFIMTLGTMTALRLSLIHILVCQYAFSDND